MKKFLRVHEVAKALGIGKSTVWAWAKDNKLPKGVKISGKVTVWDEVEIYAWMQNYLKKRECDV